METRNIFGAGSSPNVFPRSSREFDDDEEALKWAALEKLPTYNRVRKGLILSGNEGELKEIDVKRLQFHDRQELLDRLVKVANEDNEKFLYKLKDRIDRVGIEMPTIEVRFENINVEAEVYVGDRGLPTNLNSLLNAFEAFANCLHILPSRKKPLSILHGVSGIVKPGRMTLLLGPPGSGKTTLLLALAGKLANDLKVSGKVAYNGHEMDEFVPQRTAAYISQHDVHVGEMTVRETLSFSARCQGVGPRYEMLTELSRREKEANIKPDPDLDVFMKASSIPGKEASVITDYTLKILGLEICADTLVGDAMQRGISGGQKKRVTTGEMLVGPAKVLFMDEISTGLDSSTTYQIVNSLRQSVHILNGTAMISLLQPAPETYDLFDDIILLSDGFIVYQGPREHVPEFFEHMGFKCPERKGVADFLQEVTSRKDQRQYWADRDRPYRFVPVREFAEAFNSFHVGRRLNSELDVPYDKKRSHPAALATTKYGASMKDLLKATFDREMLLMKRNAFAHCFKTVQLGFVGIIAMTLFLRTHMHRDSVLNGGVYMGALFSAILQFTFTGMNEIPMTILKLPVFYKQRDLLFYPAWSYALPPCILRISVTLIQTSLWVFMTYYVIGFDPNVGRLFKQFLVLSALNQSVSGLFRCASGLGRSMVIASTLGSVVMILVMVLGGFIISRENIKPWWIWGYWISPLMYAQNAIAVNEFLGKSWSHILPGSTEPLGVMVLKFNGLFPQAKWYWIGVGALIGYAVLFNFLYVICLTYLDPIGDSQAAMSEDSLKEKHANIAGEMPNEIAPQKSSSNINLIQEKKGMVLPFTPLSITFSDIRYSVDTPAEMKARGVAEDKLELLKGISGSFRPGVLTALMGVSGAGKTTLMDVLAGRKTGGYIEGDITINGYPKKQETFARISGYCEQNDIHSPHVTVYESLVYSAWLRLPSDIDSATRQMFVEEVMELVELTFLRNSLVGLPGVNGLSTEQRKRLTIAVELVANPSIIFMDEPTSGLDARAAAIVMRTVRNTVDTGRTVVCTIHQPSIDIFESFDELFLMKRGGEEIYVGPLGRHSCELIKYFEGIQGVSKIKDQYNPATWMLESTSLSQELTLGVNFAQIYKNSELYRRNKALIEEFSKPPPNSTDLYFPTKYSQSFEVQCIACLWKQNLSYWRDTEYNAIRILFTLLISLFFGTIFWRLGGKIKKQADLMNAIGSMYTAISFMGAQNCITVQPIVDTERTVFYREKAAGMYSALPYAFGQVAVEVLYTLVQTIIYGVIVYGMMGLEWTAGKFFWYLFFMYFALLYFTFYGMMSVGLTANFGISSTVSTAFFAWWNLFTGFVIPRTRIPIWWRWFYWICPTAWTLYGMVSSQFGDVHEEMETGETVAEFIASYFGYKYELLGASAAIVFAFALFFAFLYAFAIKFLNFQNR